MTDDGLAFDFLRVNKREGKPRTRGLTEIRGPYYAPVGRNYLEDVFDLMGPYIDIFKFGGGTMPLMRRREVKRLIDYCHEHDVMVSTGGLLEHVLVQGEEAVNAYLDECRALEFDVVEISTGFITMPLDDVLRIVERVVSLGMRPKPEVNIQFGAGGTSDPEELAAEGTSDPGWAVHQAKKCLEAGAELVMVESEGITEQVAEWRTDVPAIFINALGLENLMFEAADPEVFGWYIKNYGPEVSVFIDHSQIILLESLRAGTWGNKSLWGRVVTYKGEGARKEG